MRSSAEGGSWRPYRDDVLRTVDPGGLMDRAMRLLKRRPSTFEIQVQDMRVRVTAPEELEAETRAAALWFWDQVHAFSLRDHSFATSERPVAVPEDAPATIRDLARIAASAGVGPMFAFRGAVADSVGAFLSRQIQEFTVACEGNYYVAAQKRVKLTVIEYDDGDSLSVVVDPSLGMQGLYSSIGTEPVEGVDGIVVLAESCRLADAAAAGAGGLLGAGEATVRALDHLRETPGVFGGLVLRGVEIGLVGRIEIGS
jgi:ApbE superfamily uncharacterized protein (UPF0280 family)